MNSYYRTGKGSHRHTSWACANQRRSLHTGDVVECTATEASEMAACEFCCDASEVGASIAAAAAQAAAAPVKCEGRPANPKFIKSKCNSCGHVGTSRSWRAHAPK